MKQPIASFIMIATFLFFQSCEKKCNLNQPLNSQLSDCFFKNGSYFIYYDSTDNITDSQYVFQYSYSPGAFTLQTQECGNTTTDVISMAEVSYRNGSFYDTLYSSTYDGTYLVLYDSRDSWFVLNESPTYSPSPYNSITNFSVGNTIYPLVYSAYPAYAIQNTDTVTINRYYAPGYGIVKTIWHYPTKDVSWDLIRYHIVP